MYFPVKMGIFQPAMSVYQRVNICSVPMGHHSTSGPTPLLYQHKNLSATIRLPQPSALWWFGERYFLFPKIFHWSNCCIRNHQTSTKLWGFLHGPPIVGPLFPCRLPIPFQYFKGFWIWSGSMGGWGSPRAWGDPWNFSWELQLFLKKPPRW